MIIEKSIKCEDDFFECFQGSELKELEINIERKNVNFGVLKCRNNNFNLDILIKYLTNVCCSYAIPAKRLSNLKDQWKLGDIQRETKEKFIDYGKANNGEGGELIIYALLENHLNAPKLLSKMKLKTNNQMPVFGSDGIHLLCKSDKKFELIFCESKMYKDLNKGIMAAFESIDNFLDDDGNRSFENTVISTNISGEFDDEIVKKLSDVILPSKEGHKINDAISIFVGFEYSTDNRNKAEDNDVYEEKLVCDITKKIEKSKDSFDEYFNSHCNFSFYVYLIPFECIDKTRKCIIKNITGE